MASFHAIQMDDPLDKREGSHAQDGLFHSATVAQSHIQVRLGKGIVKFVTAGEALASFNLAVQL